MTSNQNPTSSTGFDPTHANHQAADYWPYKVRLGVGQTTLNPDGATIDLQDVEIEYMTESTNKWQRWLIYKSTADMTYDRNSNVLKDTGTCQWLAATPSNYPVAEVRFEPDSSTVFQSTTEKTVLKGTMYCQTRTHTQS